MHKIQQFDYIDQMLMHIFYFLNHTLNHLMIFVLQHFIIFLMDLLLVILYHYNFLHYVLHLLIDQMYLHSLVNFLHLDTDSRGMGIIFYGLIELLLLY